MGQYACTLESMVSYHYPPRTRQHTLDVKCSIMMTKTAEMLRRQLRTDYSPMCFDMFK